VIPSASPTPTLSSVGPIVPGAPAFLQGAMPASDDDLLD
jgi:hypothetical protein